MLDLETLGSRPTAAITQLGACYFDINTGEVGATYKQNIDIGSSLLAGLTVDEDTIRWWQERIGSCGTWLEDTEPIQHRLTEFAAWIVANGKVKSVWSHATFDIPILQNAYQVVGIKMPFHYRTARDIRTLVDLSGLKIPTGEMSANKTHDALEDCLYQVEYCTKCYKELMTRGQKESQQRISEVGQ